MEKNVQIAGTKSAAVKKKGGVASAPLFVLRNGDWVEKSVNMVYTVAMNRYRAFYVHIIKKIGIASVAVAFFALSIMGACPGMSAMADTEMAPMSVSMNCTSVPQASCLFDIGKHIQRIGIPQEVQQSIVSFFFFVFGVLTLSTQLRGDDFRRRSRWLFYRFKNSLARLFYYFVALFSDGILNTKIYI